MPDEGIVCMGMHEGREVLGMRVSWDKRYITLAPAATVLGLAFKARDPDGLLGKKKSLGITCALTPTATPGVETGNRHRPGGSIFLNGPTRGKDVFIPMDWIIGGQARIGQGWRMLMHCLAAGRAISLPSQSVANGKLACMTAGAYRIFHPINGFFFAEQLHYFKDIRPHHLSYQTKSERHHHFPKTYFLLFYPISHYLSKVFLGEFLNFFNKQFNFSDNQSGIFLPSFFYSFLIKLFRRLKKEVTQIPQVINKIRSFLDRFHHFFNKSNRNFNSFIA